MGLASNLSEYVRLPSPVSQAKRLFMDFKIPHRYDPSNEKLVLNDSSDEFNLFKRLPSRKYTKLKSAPESRHAVLLFKTGN